MYDLNEDVLYLFTDWASRSVYNPQLNRKTWRYWGKGAWMVYLNEKWEEEEEDLSDNLSYKYATNQDMELQAAIDGLEFLRNKDLSIFKKIMIVTDSRFLFDNWKCSVFWYWNKPGVNRRTRNWDTIVHKKEWKKLAKIYREIIKTKNISIDFNLVKGHKDNKYNNKADKSAVRWAQSNNRIVLKWRGVRKPFFEENSRFKEWYIDDIQWDTIFLHMICYRHIRGKYYRYNCEIVSWDHEYYKKTWWINCNQKTLSAKYIYLVKMKNDGSHFIDEIIAEYDKEDIKKKMKNDWIETKWLLYWKWGLD